MNAPAFLGKSKSERVLRSLLLAFIFLMPIGTVLILAEPGTTGRAFFTTPLLYPAEILAALAGLIWLARHRPRWRDLRPYRWLGVVVAVAATSFIWAPDPGLAVAAAGHLVVGLMLLVMLAELLRDRRFAGAAAATFVGAVGLQAIWAVGQAVIGHDLGLRWLGESILRPDLPGVAKVMVDQAKQIRPYGSLPHPNVLAAYLATGIFLVAALSFWSWRRPDWWRLAYPAVLSILAVALVLTLSRVALLVTAINGTLFVLFARRRWRRLPAGAGLAAAVVLAAAVLVWPQLSSRAALETPQETGLSNRVVGYQLAGTMISDRPLGVGAGNFVPASRELRADLPEYQRQPAHNALLLAAAELGAIPATLLLAWLVRLGWLFHQDRPRDRRRLTIDFAIFCLAGVFIAIGLTDHFFWSLPQGLWLAVLLAAAALSRLPRPTLAKF